MGESNPPTFADFAKRDALTTELTGHSLTIIDRLIQTYHAM